MDRIAIGKFISACRHDKKLTQKQLAELLNVTPKSVSKWENGSCLPAAAQYERLCEILGISINELFAGKRIPTEEYLEIVDRNLLQMLKYRLYCFGHPPIPFPEFDKALTRIAALTEELRGFDEKDHAVNHMMQESGAGYEECAKAYDFYIRLFRIHEAEEEKQ